MPAVFHYHQISLLQRTNYVDSLVQICHGQNSFNITQVLHTSLPTPVYVFLCDRSFNYAAKSCTLFGKQVSEIHNAPGSFYCKL